MMLGTMWGMYAATERARAASIEVSDETSAVA